MDAYSAMAIETPNQFWSDFRSNISVLNYPLSEALRQAGYVYDAVWAAAFALDEVDRQLKAGVLQGRTSLQNFSYTDTGINQLIFNSAKKRMFRGVTGVVAFNEFGDREPTGEMYQFTLSDTINYTLNALPVFQPFAVINQERNGLDYVNGSSEETVFPNGVPMVVEVLHINIGLCFVMIILSVAGLLFSTVCIVFNLVFSNKRLVKLTSPYLNVVTIIGAIFFYIDVILFGIDGNLIPSRSFVEGLCQARIWISSIGFSLLFGPMLAKAFRVYYIFRSVKLKKKPMKDWILLTMVAVMVAIDVVFLIIVSIGGFRLILIQRLIIRDGGRLPLSIDSCSSEASQIWLPFLLAYKAVYLLIGLMLAGQTYNVTIKELRDSKLIVISVFAIFVISAVLTVIGFFVDSNPNAFYALLASLILLLITGVMGLLFIPRMVELWKNPSGDIQVTSVTNNVSNPALTDSNSAEDNAKITELRNTIASLKAEIESVKRSQSKEAMSESTTALNKSLEMKSSLANLLSPGQETKPFSTGVTKEGGGAEGLEMTRNMDSGSARNEGEGEVETKIDDDNERLSAVSDEPVS